MVCPKLVTPRMSTQHIQQTAPPKSERGRKNVETKLIRSACKLLSELGPRAVTIRDIAADAGVNHGQIHHYFGGKKGLISEAFRHLAQEHMQNAIARGLNDFGAPPALTLGRDQQFANAVVRSVLDGEIELATRDIADNTSVPRHILGMLSEAVGGQVPATQIKAAIALTMATELAWAGLEEYIFVMTDVQPHEAEAVRQQVGDASRALLKALPTRQITDQ